MTWPTRDPQFRLNLAWAVPTLLALKACIRYRTDLEPMRWQHNRKDGAK